MAIASAALALSGCTATSAGDAAMIDADAEKVLLLADFESDAEIVNAADERGALAAKKSDAQSPCAVWVADASNKWGANRLEISDEHVFHGEHSVKVTVNAGVGHGWFPTVRDSFPADWTDYDSIRFFVHWPEETPCQWTWFQWLLYTNAEGGDSWIQGWLLFAMKKGDSQIEIPLSAFDDLKWPGPIGGSGGGINCTTANVPKDQPKKYAYLHKVGWKFDRVYKLATGLRGEYDTKVPHVYWIDYIRLVKKKKN
jgi:hypothetical protein